jgi:membrane peptidoglycan carboxypeptidase
VSKIARLVAVGAAVGVLVAGIALPAVGGVGLGIVSATSEVNLKPEDLVEPPPAEVTIVQDVRGNEIARFYEENRESIKLDQMAEVMKTAIISIEDYRFYEHGAIDLEGTIRALAKNLQANGVSQGGSSITQQYVKQVLYNAADTEKEKKEAVESSYARKLNELRYAMWVEEQYSKDEILEKYLNIAYFGASAYGVEAAAKRFFGVDASELTLPQAATLAGAVQDPNSTDPNLGAKQRELLVNRRNVVLNRMAELKKITPAEAAEAKATKLGYKGTKLPGGCESSKYAYFCLYVRNEILKNPAFGKTAKNRTDFLNRGGLTIKTTINPTMQAAADKAIRNWVHPSDNPAAFEALIQPGTGAIKAMASSRAYGQDEAKNEIAYNLVADAAHGGAVGFQAGSTFKTFTLLTALEKGMKINDGFSAGAGYLAPGLSTFKNCKGQPIGDPSHTITNDEGSPGWKTLQTGTWDSVNTFFLMLEQKVGLCDTIKTAKSLGIHRSDGGPLQEFETFTLGINEMDPVTVANAYAAIGAHGKYCAPMAITQITDRDGKVKAYQPKCRQALDPEVADAAADVLSGVLDKGTMKAVGGIGRDAGGKTGTTDSSAAAWFAGFTPDLAGAVSIGDPRGAQDYKLNNVTIGGRYYPSVFGATIPGPIWKETMIGALKGVPPTPFTPINAERFGGCGQSCQPAPPPVDNSETFGDGGFNSPDSGLTGPADNGGPAGNGGPGGNGRPGGNGGPGGNGNGRGQQKNSPFG